MSKCQCLTAKGTQCSRNASAGSRFCYQHQDCQKVVGGVAAPIPTKTTVAAATTVPSRTHMIVPTPMPMQSPITMSISSTSRVIAPPKLPPAGPRASSITTPMRATTSSTSMTVRSPVKASEVSARAQPKIANVPTATEITEINKTLKHLEELVEGNEAIREELYIDLPSMRKYQLTMEDVKKIGQNPKQKFFMIEPQTYDEIREFGDDLDMFYDYQGKAVTGSGADLWILYKPGLLDTLKSIARNYEALPTKTVASRRQQLGEEIYTKASMLLNDPEGRRLRALRATKAGYPTVQKTASGLCHDLKSEMYRDELIELAEDLDLPITKNITKAELCKMIAQYAEEAYIPVPEKVEAKVAEKNLKKAMGVSDAEAAHNLERFQNLSWSMGHKPEDAWEFIEQGESTIFPEFPEHIEETTTSSRGRNNILDQGQLDLVISNNNIIVDWINPDGEDEELPINGPVTYRKVFHAIDTSLKKFAKANDAAVEDLVCGGHSYWEGFTPVKGKPGHYEAHF